MRVIVVVKRIINKIANQFLIIMDLYKIIPTIKGIKSIAMFFKKNSEVVFIHSSFIIPAVSEIKNKINPNIAGGKWICRIFSMFRLKI